MVEPAVVPVVPPVKPVPAVVPVAPPGTPVPVVLYAPWWPVDMSEKRTAAIVRRGLTATTVSGRVELVGKISRGGSIVGCSQTSASGCTSGPASQTSFTGFTIRATMVCRASCITGDTSASRRAGSGHTSSQGGVSGCSMLVKDSS